MITKALAIQTAQRHIDELYKGSKHAVRIIESNIETRHNGWVFFYDTKEAIETGRVEYMLIGNAPLFIENKFGKLYTLESGRNIDECIAKILIDE